jgi:transposase
MEKVGMEAIIERCAGIDVHEKTVVVCVLKGDLKKKPEKEIETFNTTTTELLKLLNWIEERGCTQVAMESTGVYWKPVWNVLESGDFEMILANARHIKNLPGRKTDVKDAEWIAQLLRSGLINKSFVPDAHIRDLRDLTRYRKKILYETNREKNRIHKILEDCNIKISSYISDIFGDTGRKILDKIMNQEEIRMTDLIEISNGRGKASIRKKLGEIKEAVNGKVRKHHLTMIKYSYNHVKFLEQQIMQIEKEIEEYIEPYLEEVEIVDTIPGINKNAASVIIAEIGTDMSYFPTDKHITSWAGLSPGNCESAGKKKK